MTKIVINLTDYIFHFLIVINVVYVALNFLLKKMESMRCLFYLEYDSYKQHPAIGRTTNIKNWFHILNHQMYKL